jgi:hypothetical protein
MAYTAINLKEKLGKFSEHWLPRVVAELNDYQFKLAKTQGDAPQVGQMSLPIRDNGQRRTGRVGLILFAT